MMTTCQPLRRIETRQVWLIGLSVAGIFCIPLALLSSTAPWLIALPIVVGALLVLWLEMRSDPLFKRKADRLSGISELAAELPSDHLGLPAYRGQFQIELPTHESEQQLELLANLAPPKKTRQRKDVRVVELSGGELSYVIDGDRFMALVVSRMMDDADKAADHALAMAVKRFGKVRGVGPEVYKFLSDQTIIEVMRADYRGNLLTIINRTGEKVIKELISKAKKQEAKELASANPIPNEA